jgi:hypothetical protein
VWSEEKLGARPILTRKLVARLHSSKSPWCRWSSERSKKTPWCRLSSISRRGVGEEIPLPSLFRPRLFRSEAAVYFDNRREAVIHYGPLALICQPMNTQHWGPVLIVPGRSGTRDSCLENTGNPLFWDRCLENNGSLRFWDRCLGPKGGKKR